MRRLAGRERLRTKSSDHCGFESQLSMSVEPRRSGNRLIFMLTGRVG